MQEAGEVPCEGLAGWTAPISADQACEGRKIQGGSGVRVCVCWGDRGTGPGFSVISSQEK